MVLLLIVTPLISLDLYHVYQLIFFDKKVLLFYSAAYGTIGSILLIIKCFKFIFYRELYPLHINPNTRLFEEKGISNREKEIITGLVNGLSYKEISNTLYIGTSTVKTHINHIYSKLNISKRDELIQLLFNS